MKKNYLLIIVLLLISSASTAYGQWKIYVLKGNAKIRKPSSGQDLLAKMLAKFGTTKPGLEELGNLSGMPQKFSAGVDYYQKVGSTTLAGVRINFYQNPLSHQAGLIDAFAIDGADLDWLMSLVNAKQKMPIGWSTGANEYLAHYTSRLSQLETGQETFQDAVNSFIVALHANGLADIPYSEASRRAYALSELYPNVNADLLSGQAIRLISGAQPQHFQSSSFQPANMPIKEDLNLLDQ